jgi:hypothetical protein
MNLFSMLDLNPDQHSFHFHGDFFATLVILVVEFCESNQRTTKNKRTKIEKSIKLGTGTVYSSVGDPDPVPYVFGPPGSGSVSTRYGSGSESGSRSSFGSFYHPAKIVRKPFIPPVL